MGHLFPQAENEEIRAAGRGTPPIDQRQPHAGQRARKNGGRQPVAGIHRKHGKYQVHQQGGDHHGPQGPQKERAPQRPDAQKDDGHVQQQCADADGDVQKVIGKDGQAGDAAGGELCRRCKAVDACRVQGAAHHIHQQVQRQCRRLAFGFHRSEKLLSRRTFCR